MVSLLLAVIYLVFISLGLPDSLLGSAWPLIYPQFDIPVSWSGPVFMIISLGTVISSLASDYLTSRFKASRVTCVSVMMTAVAMLGFASSKAYWQLCFWAIPYGLGAGSIDAALNNYVALHYESRHMSWLHCMWGVGASIGPYIMSFAVTSSGRWERGYLIVGLIQVVLSAIILLSLPLWKQEREENREEGKSHHGILATLKIPGVWQVMLCFFCYQAIEQTCGLWTSSYLVLVKNIEPQIAAGFASLFYLGITMGRAINGFLTFRFNDHQMIRTGSVIIALGIALMLIAGNASGCLIGIVLVGLGCAPIYPSIIHSTPEHFGRQNSQAVIGLQMASAYVGTLSMPPLFGFIAEKLGIALMPWYLLLFLLIMMLMFSQLVIKTRKND